MCVVFNYIRDELEGTFQCLVLESLGIGLWENFPTH